MKKTFIGYNYLIPCTSIWIILTLLISFKTLGQEDKSKLKKQINESFEYTSGRSLLVDNVFGDVKVIEGDKNKIEVNVTVEVFAKNEDAAKKLLEKVNIEKDVSDSKISFKTKVPDRDKGDYSWDEEENHHYYKGKGNKGGINVDYEIHLPKGASLEIENKFGSVFFDEFEGDLDIKVQFGKFIAKNLKGDKNKIEVSFGDLEINEAGELDLTLKYGSNSEIEKVDKLDLDLQFGKLEVEQVKTIEGSSKYSQLNIEKVSLKCNVDSKFGGIEIEELDKNFEEVDVDASYGSLKIYFEEGASFDFHVEAKFGSLNNKLDDLVFTREIEKFSHNEYEGRRGSGGGKVRAKASFGSVRFDER